MKPFCVARVILCAYKPLFMGKKRKIGLLGGTFNPFHLGHLSIGRDAIAHAGLDLLIFVPNTISPFKLDEQPVSGEQRLEMMSAAVRDEPGFAVSDVEVARGGISYTIDTIREIQRAYPDAEIVFCLGADSLVDFHAWKEPYAILAEAFVLPLARPGFDLGADDLSLDGPWPNVLLERMCTVNLVDVSSTEIRDAVAKGKCINALVPAEVAAYIKAWSLYKIPEPETGK